MRDFQLVQLVCVAVNPLSLTMWVAMWVVIIVCNVGIAIVCWRVVFWLLRFRPAVANFRQTIVAAEENCRSGLDSAPESIWIAQSQVRQFRKQFREWQYQRQAQELLLRRWWYTLLWGQRFIRIQFQGRSGR